MSNNINIENATLFTGVTSTGTFLLTLINNRQVGIPLFTFDVDSTTPELDFIPPSITVGLNATQSTLTDNATSYGAAVALTVNSSGFCVPLYRTAQSTSIAPEINFAQATIVNLMSSTGEYMLVKAYNNLYGIPLYLYSSLYPNLTTSVEVSSINIDTIVAYRTKDKSADISPSTNLNPKIKTYSQLINRIKYTLGAPFLSLEICDDYHIVDYIDQAIEWYTKYAGYTEEYLIFNSSLYSEPGLRIDQLYSLTPSMRSTLSNGMSACWDYDFGDYRKVIGVFDVEQGETTGINTLFTLEQAMAQQTYFSYMLGNVGFDLVTWEVLKQWLDLREKVLAQKIYVDFDNRNQLLRLIPPPTSGSRYYGVVGCWVEKPIRDLIMERWVYHYSLALTKYTIATIRSKFGSVQLLGGGTIQYSELLAQSREDKLKLEEELMNGYGEVTPARFFLG